MSFSSFMNGSTKAGRMLVRKAIQFGFITELILSSVLAKVTWDELEYHDVVWTLWNFSWTLILGSALFIFVWLIVLLIVSRLHKMSTGYALFEKPNQDNKNQ